MSLVVFSLILLVAGAFVTMIVGYADEYRTVRINYQFENGDTAYDSYIGVFQKSTSTSTTRQSAATRRWMIIIRRRRPPTLTAQ